MFSIESRIKQAEFLRLQAKQLYENGKYREGIGIGIYNEAIDLLSDHNFMNECGVREHQFISRLFHNRAQASMTLPSTTSRPQNDAEAFADAQMAADFDQTNADLGCCALD